jgi:hypothetical protein
LNPGIFALHIFLQDNPEHWLIEFPYWTTTTTKSIGELPLTAFRDHWDHDAEVPVRLFTITSLEYHSVYICKYSIYIYITT